MGKANKYLSPWKKRNSEDFPELYECFILGKNDLFIGIINNSKYGYSAKPYNTIGFLDAINNWGADIEVRFESIEIAFNYVNDKLEKSGYKFLSQEQFNKLQILI